MKNVHKKAAEWIEGALNEVCYYKQPHDCDVCKTAKALVRDLREAGKRCVPEGWTLGPQGLTNDAETVRVTTSLGGLWVIRTHGRYNFSDYSGCYRTWQDAMPDAIVAADAAETETQAGGGETEC